MIPLSARKPSKRARSNRSSFGRQKGKQESLAKPFPFTIQRKDDCAIAKNEESTARNVVGVLQLVDAVAGTMGDDHAVETLLGHHRAYACMAPFALGWRERRRAELCLGRFSRQRRENGGSGSNAAGNHGHARQEFASIQLTARKSCDEVVQSLFH